MGTLYFIIKNSIVTLALVSLMQIQFGGRSLESRLMNYIRHDLAPNFLGAREDTYIKSSELKLHPEDLVALRKKIYESPYLSGVKDSAKEIFMKEISDIMKKREEALFPEETKKEEK